MSFDEQPDAPLHGECAAEIAALRQQLLVAQAEVKRLRDTLKEVKDDLVQRAEMDPEDGGAVLNVGNGVLRRMNEALSTPSDTSAIDALQRDAERYRWLREGDNDEDVLLTLSDGEPFLLRCGALDDAIDAAIGASHD